MNNPEEQEQEIIDNNRGNGSPDIINPGSWDKFASLFEKTDAIDKWLKEKVDRQGKYTNLAMKKIQDIKSQYTDLKKQMADYQATISQYQEEKTVHEDLIDALTQQGIESATTIEELREKGKAFDNQAGEKDKQIEQLKEKIKSLELVNEDLKQQIEKLMQQLAEKQASEDTLNEEIRQKVERITSLTAEVNGLNTRITELEKTIEETGNNSQQTIANLTKEKQLAELAKDTAEARIATLEAELEAANARIAELEAEKQAVEDEKAAVDAELKAQQAEVTRLNDIEANLTRERDELQARAEAAEADVRRLTNELAQITAELQAKQGESDQLSALIESIRASLVNLHNDEYNTLVDKLNEILVEGDISDDGNDGGEGGGGGGGGGGGKGDGAHNTKVLAKQLGNRRNPLTQSVSKTAAGGDTSPKVQSMVVPEASRAQYTQPSFVKTPRAPTYNSTNNPARSVASSAASSAAFQGQQDEVSLTTNPLLAKASAQPVQSGPDPNTRYDIPPSNALDARSVNLLRENDLIYVRDAGASPKDNTRYRLAKLIENPHKADGSFRIQFIHSNNGTDPETTEIQVNRVKRVLGQTEKDAPKGGAYKSKKYRKLPVKKSKKHYNKANNKANNKKTTMKKKRNMRGGFIANYKTPSSSKDKTKKARKTNSSSLKTTTSSKR